MLRSCLPSVILGKNRYDFSPLRSGNLALSCVYFSDVRVRAADDWWDLIVDVSCLKSHRNIGLGFRNERKCAHRKLSWRTVLRGSGLLCISALLLVYEVSGYRIESQCKHA
jgi:hypothetical protein